MGDKVNVVPKSNTFSVIYSINVYANLYQLLLYNIRKLTLNIHSLLSSGLWLMLFGRSFTMLIFCFLLVYMCSTSVAYMNYNILRLYLMSYVSGNLKYAYIHVNVSGYLFLLIIKIFVCC